MVESTNPFFSHGRNMIGLSTFPNVVLSLSSDKSDEKKSSSPLYINQSAI